MIMSLKGKEKMTTGLKRLWHLAYRSFGAVLLGSAFVLFVALILANYGETQETASVVAAKSIKFPDNEKMLAEQAAELARQGAALSSVEPAAGDKKPGVQK
jgi:hypothetical protein